MAVPLPYPPPSKRYLLKQINVSRLSRHFIILTKDVSKTSNCFANPIIYLISKRFLKKKHISPLPTCGAP